MNVEFDGTSLYIKNDSSINEDKFNEIPSTTEGFVYMDMGLYAEEDKGSCNDEIKRKVDLKDFYTEVEKNVQCSETLPLNSIKNVAYQDEILDFNNSYCSRKAKKLAEVNLIQKENCIEEKRYTLRARASLKKISNVKNLELISGKISRKKNKKIDCNTKLSVNFKCLSCNDSFSLEQLLNKQIQQYKSSKLKTKFEFHCEICKKCFTNTLQLEKHLITHENEIYNCSNCSKELTENKLELDIIKNESVTKEYTCDICKKSFICMSTLKRHISAHMNSFQSECQNCFEKLENLESGHKHSCTNAKNTSNSCHVCNKNFLQSIRLKIHLRRQHGIIYKCSKCKKSFESPDKLKYHLTEIDCHAVIQTCPKCGKSYKDSSSYKKHLQIHTHPANKCDNCKKIFVDSDKFNEHISLRTCQKPFRKLKYECDECGNKFLKLVKLKIHILNVHQGINYQCEKCNEKFSSQEDLDDHVNKENCKQEDPCTCKICGKVFAKRDYLKKHEYMHTSILYKCKYCYCAFMKEKSYNRHVEKMNCSKSARKIKMAEFNFRKCRICEVEYKTEELLIEHFGESHPGQQPHQCFCCESCLPTFRDLQNHIHHHNIKKYTCNLCGKPYTSQEGFRKHRLKHKGAEFKCKFCESEFLNESRFKFHEKTCKKNPESGYEPLQDKPKKKDERPKQSRQLHWESRIIMKHLRGDPKSNEGKPNSWSGSGENSFALSFFDEDDTDTTNERGWFDNYYKTEEDDIAFGLKKEDNTAPQDCESDYEVGELVQTTPVEKSKKTLPSGTQNIEDCDANGSGHSPSDSSEDSESTSSEEESFEEEELQIDYNPKKCRLCGITFGQEYELLHHFIKVHPNEWAHKCPNCDVQSPLFAQLKEHMKAHGIGIGIFNCDNCSKKFRSEKKMKSHNIRCKGMNADEDKKAISASCNVQCKRCGKKFHTRFGYRRHKQLCKMKKSKTKSSSVPAKIREVPANNDCAQNTSPHLIDDDNPAEKKNKSSIQINGILSNRNENHANGESKPLPSEQKKSPEKKDSYAGEPPMDSFPCRLCDKKFQYERGIVMHFKSAHPGHKPLICHVCNMHLADKLKEHLKTHGIGEEFICELCGKRFNQKFLSKIHEMWHQGIEYKCNNCKQKFLNKEKMDKHISENRCSNRLSLMRLPCVICGKSYRSKFGLSKHYITHTPKELRPVKNRMNCEYCGKWFENNNGLQRHRRIHTGERPFCCRFCPKAFAQEGNCKAHERIHTGESKPRKKKQPPLQQQQQQQQQITTTSTEALPYQQIISQVPQPTQQDVTQITNSSAADPMTFSNHINLYIYNNIDPNGIVQ